MKVFKAIAYYATGLYHRISSDNMFLTSGGLAFSVLTCIIPFVLILFSILGSLLEVPAIERQIMTLIRTVVPFEDSSTAIEDFVFARIHEFKMFKTLAGYLGALVLLFTASGLFSSLRTILNNIFGISPDKPAILSKLRDLVMVLVVILSVLLSTIFFPLLDVLDTAISQIPAINASQFAFLHGVVLSGLTTLMLFLAMYLLYYLVPETRMKPRVAALSAFWFVALWALANQVFGYYITHFATLKNIYGAYFLLVIGIFWIYYSAFIFIISAEMGQLYRLRNSLK